jgi:hypothetical protein
MKSRLIIIAAVATLLVSGAAVAHHSRANFELDRIVTIEGTVTEWSWRSPHVWMKVESPGENGEVVEWLVEGNAIPGLRRRGWSKESFAVGDEVVASGNPDRNPDNKLMFLVSIMSDTQSLLYNFKLPPEEEARIAALMKPTEPSTDFSGIWERVASNKYFLTGSFNPPQGWPLTAKGEAQVAEFDLVNDPYLRCHTTAIPRLTYSPFGHRWIRDGDTIRIEKEFNPNARIIHLGMTEHPENIEPSRVGHSIGWFEGDTLVVDTIGFVYDDWGNYRGLDSSEQKHIVERYTLTNDGYGLHMELTQMDPEFLTEPYTMEWDYRKQKEYEFEYQPCTIESAARHLELNE